MDHSTSIDKAINYLQAAYTELKSAGIDEQFFALAVDTCSPEMGRFFGNISSVGCRLTFKRNYW